MFWISCALCPADRLSLLRRTWYDLWPKVKMHLFKILSAWLKCFEFHVHYVQQIDWVCCVVHDMTCGLKSKCICLKYCQHGWNVFEAHVLYGQRIDGVCCVAHEMTCSLKSLCICSNHCPHGWNVSNFMCSMASESVESVVSHMRWLVAQSQNAVIQNIVSVAEMFLKFMCSMANASMESAVSHMRWLVA